MKKFLAILLLILSIAGCAGSNRLFKAKQSAQPVAFTNLLNELTDLTILAEVPDYQFTYKQASSYDRRSTNPYDKTETNWFANADAGQFIRVENKTGTNEYVMMDANGPGAIVRIWSANPGGIIRIYLDGNEKPEIEMPMKEILNGKNKLFPNPICYVAARGWNSYMPIPYAKHCKITTTQKDVYYHVGFRTYDAETKVLTYSIEDAKANLPAIMTTMGKLLRPERLSYKIIVDQMANFTVDLNPDASYKYDSDKNVSGKIYSFLCKISAVDIEKALRETILEITFDNEEKPFVNVPLGDFFGTAPGLNKYRSVSLGVLDDGAMYCHWVMPFKKNFTLKITNCSDNKLTLSGNIIYSKEKWNYKNRYFHANWNSFINHPTRPFFDWTILKCYGKGSFVGTMMQIYNPVRKWWGEGDEKIFVDGEYFPSVFGTGTEDYFGYAWGDQTVFSRPFHCQSKVEGPEFSGNTCNSRFQIIDNIPFDKSLEFNMEVWTHTSTTVSMASTVYWYAEPDSEDAFDEININDLKTFNPTDNTRNSPGTSQITQ